MLTLAGALWSAGVPKRTLWWQRKEVRLGTANSPGNQAAPSPLLVSGEGPFEDQILLRGLSPSPGAPRGPGPGREEPGSQARKEEGEAARHGAGADCHSRHWALETGWSRPFSSERGAPLMPLLHDQRSRAPGVCLWGTLV